ncbi:MAG: hypothetical protein HUJ26_05715 [Planctomycetaceae bacterium]|nr:hypothetical protein [Planctomycetaceae bacterium]
MKRVKQNQKRRIRKRSAAQLADDRNGSVIVVVISLLAALMVLGFFVFSLARQEKENAEYFKQASKRLEPLEFDPNAVFDCFLKQLILGPAPDEYQTPLWGGHMSLLPTMYGTDIHPFNGEGVNAVWEWGAGGDGAPGIAGVDDDGDGFTDYLDPPTNSLPDYDEYGVLGSDDVPLANGIPRSDMNYDGNPELSVANDYHMQLNQSPAAQAAVNDIAGNNDLRQRPEPDVDYTYPDHNNPFLTYIGVMTNQDGSVRTPIVIPAFHRPQLMRNLGPAPANFVSSGSTTTRSLIPHVEHRVVRPDGTVTNTRRFVSGAYPEAGMTNFDGNDTRDESFWASGATVSSTLTYPVDPTGKGLPNALYLDCGFGIQEDPTTGQQFVPMVAVTVLDAESLFNLNVHGNTTRGLDSSVNLTNAASMGGAVGGNLLSTSHQGVSRGEINPGWALNAVPQLAGSSGDYSGTAAELAAALEQYRHNYGGNPVVNPATGPEGELPRFRHLANMELWNLIHGWYRFNSGAPEPAPQGQADEPMLGRYGEEIVLYNALATRTASDYPWAGSSTTDDNRDASRGLQYDPSALYGAATGGFPYVNGMPGDLHPLDFFGFGNFQNPNFTRSFYPATPGPTHKYPSYNSYYVNGANRYASLMAPNIMGTNLVSFGTPGVTLQNEPEEMLFEEQFALLSTTDDYFDASQNALLQLSNLDLIANGMAGRVLDLAPFNFSANDRAEAIRAKFTSISSEPLSYQHSAKIPAVDNTGNPVAPANWGRNNGSNFDLRERTWEVYNQVGGFYEFPPRYSSAGPVSFDPASGNVLNFPATVDPFRNELRELIYNSALDNTSNLRLMQRLHLNKVLDRNPAGELRFRPLTPHPANPGAANIPTTGPTRPEQIGNGAFGTPAQDQEFLARLDRQRLARDLFVLLYTFGGRDDTINYAQANDPYSYNSNPETIRRMAQFAVNVVDALDPDDVVTKFEYDANLSDGWNLNDNPFVQTGAETSNSFRGEVFGQEEQTLCLNEALAVFAKKVRNNADTADIDQPLTEWNDQTNHKFVYLELENVSSRAVSFQDNRHWRIVTRISDATAGTETRLYLRNGAPTVGTGANSRYTIASSDTGTLNGGGTFSSLASDGETSRMRIKSDPADGSTIEPIAPANSDGTMEFDLRKFTSGTEFDLEDDMGAAIPTAEKNMLNLDLNQLETSGAAGYTVEFILQRRAHPARAEVTNDADNPWVVMDRLRTPLQSLELVEDDDSVAEMQPKLEALISKERVQPLNGRPQTEMSNPGVLDANNQGGAFPEPYRASSIGDDNTQQTATLPYSMWQPHFNRQFASLSELFSIPLYGPQPMGDYTDPYNATDIPELTFTIGGDNDPETVGPIEENTFGYFVFNPHNRTPANIADDNRWYRILEFIKLPTRQDLEALRDSSGATSPYVTNVGRSGDGTIPPIFRNHGPINMNMLRHPEVLAGLIDEPEMLKLNNIQGALTELLPAGFADPTRPEWFTALTMARDRNDPVLGVANSTVAPVPGIPGISKPFRSLANSNRDVRALENTLLREHVRYDTSTGSGLNAESRRLFEIGTLAQHNNNFIDYTTKHKLLGKVLNNGTTMSNTFFVFMQIDFFEAKEVAPDVVRIGGKLTDSPGYRSFCVIDRAKALQIVKPADLPPLVDPNDNTKTVFSFNQGFNWRALIRHRQRLN